jgi:hypothetical protein
MIAYLLSGSAETFFVNLEDRLAIALEVVAEFPNRPHRIMREKRDPDLRGRV